jgi:hemolysin D
MIKSSLQLQAISDMYARYRAAIRQAWRDRDQKQSVERLPHEMEFLPAALSLQETPMSAAPRLIMWLLIGFAVLALTWAIFGRIDVVAVAQGKVIPTDRIKTIQAFDNATVKSIAVRDGQQVKAGDILVELDSTVAQADQDRVQGELMSAKLQVARTQALLAALDSQKALEVIRPTDVDETKYVETQRLFLGQLAEIRAKQNRIEAEMAKKEAEKRSTLDLVRKLEQTLPIAKLRAHDYKNLMDQNFVSRHAYLEREQARIEQEADLANLRSRLIEIDASFKEVMTQRTAFVAETRRAFLDGLTDAQQKIAALQQDGIKTQQRGKLLQLRSPVDGTIQQLDVFTLGGVVVTAQKLMVVVPRDEAIEVEAFLENKDIGFVKPNHLAEVKVDTFQFTKYGTVGAKIVSVSHDAIQDEKRGLIYAVKAKLNQSTIDIDGSPVALTPGMAVSVEIKTGRRRVIEYFLAPLMQRSRDSFRER